MLLQASEAAQALNVDEKTLLRWIKRSDLPAERVDGGYRTDSVALLEWATAHGMKVNPALYKMEEGGKRILPTLSRALEAGGFHHAVAGGSKDEVLRTVVAQLELPPQIDPEYLLQVLLAREAIGTTAVGDGIAIPHVRNPILVQLPEPKVSLSYLAQPLDFGALDGRPVDTLFTLIAPNIRTHLHLLSQLAFCLGDPRLRLNLGPERDPKATVAAIRLIESEMEKLSLFC